MLLFDNVFVEAGKAQGMIFTGKQSQVVYIFKMDVERG